MFSFSWKSRYSVGVEDLDRQHQTFMKLLNDLHEVMMAGNTLDAATPLIDKLVRLAGQHFAAEEGLMELTGYPGLDAHRAQHEELSRKVNEFLVRHRNGDKAMYSHFMYFVREWFTRHMEKDDQQYAPWLAEHGIH